MPPAQANEALRAATERLGGKGKIALQGDRAVLTFSGVPFEALRDWLGEARSAARARPVEAQLLKGASGYSGSISITLAGSLMIRKKRDRQLWSPTVASTGWSESTLAEQAWVAGARRRGALGRRRRARRRARRPGAVRAGVVAGERVASATDGRLLLADARGTVWSGSAVAVLAGGPGSRDASSLPGRLEWTLAPRWYGAELAARQDCCLNGTTLIQVRPGLGRIRATLRAAHRLDRPVAERLARRPRHALEHAPARRQLPPALARA